MKRRLGDALLGGRPQLDDELFTLAQPLHESLGVRERRYSDEHRENNEPEFQRDGDTVRLHGPIEVEAPARSHRAGVYVRIAACP
jgi:hypothetical protein